MVPRWLPIFAENGVIAKCIKPAAISSLKQKNHLIKELQFPRTNP